MDTDPTPPSPEPRVVAYAQEAITDPDNPDLCMVAYVKEGESGYYRTTYSGTFEYCQKVADHINQTLGFDERAVLDVVSSSMAQSREEGKL